MRRLTRREIVIVVAAAALALAVPLYLAFFRPKLVELADAQRRLDAAAREFQQTQETARRFPQAQAERQAVAERLAVVEQRIPRSLEPAEIALLLDSAMKAGGVQLVELTFPEPAAPPPAAQPGTRPAPATGTANSLEGIVETPFTLRIRGTYPRVAQFFRFVEVLPRVLGITGITFAAGPNAPTLDITIGMKAYVLQ